MKIRVMFKTPDAIEYACDSYDIPEESRYNVTEKLKKWTGNSELIIVEFDLEEGTATVVER